MRHIIIALILLATASLRAQQSLPPGTDLTAALATSITSSQSTTPANASAAAMALDGNPATFSLTNTTTANNHWQMTLPDVHFLDAIEITNRADTAGARLHNLTLRVLDANGATAHRATLSNPGNGQKLTLYFPPGLQGKTIRIALENNANNGNNDKAVQLAEVKLLGGTQTVPAHFDIAPLGAATQKTSYSSAYPASRATDGNPHTFTHTDLATADNHWQIDLGTDREIGYIQIANRHDCCANRLDNLILRVTNAAGATVHTATLANPGQGSETELQLPPGLFGKTVRIGLENGQNNGGGNKTISLAEVRLLTPLIEPWRDTDADGMPDAYEFANGLRPGDPRDATADIDGNGRTNLHDYLLLHQGTTPGGTAPLAGGLLRDTWTGITGTTIANFTAHSKSRQLPDTTTALPLAEAPANAADNFAARLRGRLIILATGTYTFYIAADDSAQLSLGTDATPYTKTPIAAFDGYTSPRQWTKYTGQKSAPIPLQAGDELHIEALHKESGGGDHLAIGWSLDGGPITVIPGSALRLPLPLTDDQNGNNLPDPWETTHNLPATGLDSGEWGDPDGDGMNNLVEYQLGSNPNVGDRHWQWQAWTGISGNEIAAFTSHPASRLPPNATYIVDKTEAPSNWSNNHASRLRGRVLIPQDATYRFAIASDDGGELWIGLDGTPFTKQKLAHITNGWTTPRNWTYRATQTTVEIPLQQGQIIYVEALHKEGGGSDNLAVAWSIDGSALDLIPPAQLLMPETSPLDVGGNNIPDTWESTHNLPATGLDSGEWGDPDGDMLTNLREYQLQTDPLTPTSLPGHLTLEQWHGIGLYNVPELIRTTRFLGPPSTKSHLPSTIAQNLPTYSGARARGWITPPATGYYRFWITGKNSAELHLSPDHTPFAKRLICGFNASSGAGHGINQNTNLTGVWDVFSSQMSEPILLQEGVPVFCEILMQVGHTGPGWFGLAWSRDEGPREPVPATALSSWIKNPADAGDEDCLPDAWEQAHGLNPADNGLSDRTRQGELGDFDHDGLNNRTEYLLGTNSAHPDSDGDGVGDLAETNQGTDPATPDGAPATEIQNIALTTWDPAQSTGAWSVIDGGLVGKSFRGTITFPFTTPGPGHWQLELTARLKGIIKGTETMPLYPAIDGSALPPIEQPFPGAAPTPISILTPWLPAGNHTLTLHIDNEIGRRRLQIQSIRLLTPGGFDANGDGIADWFAQAITAANTLQTPPATSHVSPLHIEGHTRVAGGVQLTANGQNIPTQAGLGDNHWIANLALPATGPANLTATFENNLLTLGATTTWEPWPIEQDATLSLRAGDTLRLGPPPAATGPVTITATGATHIIEPGQSVDITFPASGTFPIQAAAPGLPTITATVTAHSATLGPVQSFYADRTTWRAYPGVNPALYIDGGPDLRIAARLPLGTGQNIQFLPRRSGTLPVAVRLHPGGPILALDTVQTIGVADALRADATTYLGTAADGYQLLRTPVVITNLPEGGRVVLTIFRAGVTFLDGTTVKTLTAADFTNGIAYIDFRYPPGMAGGYCHYIDVYDAQNRHLGRR